MQADAGKPQVLRFSTRDLPASERAPFWREVFGRQICHIDVEHQSDDPMDVEAAMLALPNLHVGFCQAATPACWKRTAELVKDGEDGIGFVLLVEGAIARSQRSDELKIKSGEGFGIIHTEPATIRFRELKEFALMLPRAALSPLVADVEEAAARLVPRSSEALRLLRRYLATLLEAPPITDLALCELAATHVHDLVALAMGATRDGAALAANRGVRAARLKAIKDDFAANPSLTLSSLASGQNVTPRYVQQLFETEGTTFTAYALDQRLTRAWRMLTSGRHAHLTVGMIALEAGFGDVSHFNRAFRRRYGAAPSEARAEAAAGSTAEAV
jgi:AraC-like DNA-binding protein